MSGLEHARRDATQLDGRVGRADRVRFIYDADGDRIGAHAWEIKANTPDNIAAGVTQGRGYAARLRAEIKLALKRKGKTLRYRLPDGTPEFRSDVWTYNYEQLMAVLRAPRGNRRDALRLAEYEAIARQAFGNATP